MSSVVLAGLLLLLVLSVPRGPTVLVAQGGDHHRDLSLNPGQCVEPEHVGEHNDRVGAALQAGNCLLGDPENALLVLLPNR